MPQVILKTSRHECSRPDRHLNPRGEKFHVSDSCCSATGAPYYNLLLHGDDYDEHKQCKMERELMLGSKLLIRSCYTSQVVQSVELYTGGRPTFKKSTHYFCERPTIQKRTHSVCKYKVLIETVRLSLMAGVWRNYLRVLFP